jgi:hypothetical protein
LRTQNITSGPVLYLLKTHIIIFIVYNTVSSSRTLQALEKSLYETMEALLPTSYRYNSLFVLDRVVGYPECTLVMKTLIPNILIALYFKI